MKILVAIANFGTKNRKYVDRLLEEYRSIKKHHVDVVVLSNINKDFGPDVEVIVGLPIKDNWSLPFGYKSLFADRMQLYDLFIYSEDDTLITEQNIDSFLKVTKILPEKYIAGFIRYEISNNERKYYSTIHSNYHWDPNSVIQIGEYIFAHYTNDHSGSFILTQEQLRKSIQSKGFLLPPRKGIYDMLVTAATDPYTQCGFKKIICISHLEDFCLHHLPNVYLGKIGIDADWADREIEKLKSLCRNDTIRGPLFDTTASIESTEWNKEYYEPVRSDVLSLIPQAVMRVLSVGCASGSTESELVKKGVEVVGIPLDCIMQVSAERRGVRVVSPNFEAAKKELQGEGFDCILFIDVLQHLENPISIIRDFNNFLTNDGYMIFSVPNFNHIKVMEKRMFGKLCRPNLSSEQGFKKYKIHFTTKRMLSDWFNRCGLKFVDSSCEVEPRIEPLHRITFKVFKNYLSKKIVVLSKKARLRHSDI